MPVPQEILAVERPVNTVVVMYGKNKDHFAVRQRIGCKNVDGRHIPVTGPTIGHIVDGKYIPIKTKEPQVVSQGPIDLKDWASVVLCDRLFKPIQQELFKVYNNEDAIRLYCMALLRVCDHGIRDYELKEAYETSFLSELYPGVALSKNTVSTFLNNLGKTCSRIRTFMRNRADAVKLRHHLLVDGTLKSDESKVNSLSDFSRKARTKGTRDISIVYAFDLEDMEPVCSECFPGNMLDITSYEAFIADNGITKGIIVADKGFPAAAAEAQFKANPDLHYLNPIKRNSKLIETHHLMEFTGILPDHDSVTYSKAKCTGKNKWLYAYRDSVQAAREEQDWLRYAKKEGKFNLETLRNKQRNFGTLVLECDLDLPPEIVYKAYSKRWEIEVFMRYYKSACQFDETHVQDDYSVIGSEFCDFLSTLLTCRLVNSFDKVELLKRMTYKKAMSILVRAKKVRVANRDWQLVRLGPSQLTVLEDLGLIPKPEEPPKRKRGRPKKMMI